jgi:hypothetical protein
MSDWRFQSRARELLASCRDNPPLAQHITGRPEWFEHTDERVAELKRIWRSAEPAIDTIEWRAWVSLGPEEAIRDVIEQSKKDLAA